MITRPCPFLGPRHQASPHRILVNVFHRVGVILDGAKRVIEKASLPQFSGLAAAAPKPVGRAELDGLHCRPDGQRVGWIQDGMPHNRTSPGRNTEAVSRNRCRAEAPRQNSELRRIERTNSRRCLSSAKAADPKTGSALLPRSGTSESCSMKKIIVTCPTELLMLLAQNLRICADFGTHQD